MRKGVLVLSLALGMVGCGGSDSGSSGDESGIPLEELSAKYAEALCAAYGNCFGDLYGIFRPGEDCVKNTTVTAEEDLATLPDAVSAGRVKYHANKLQACLDEISGGDCSVLTQREPDSCKAALEGTLKEGDDCSLDAECSGNQYCKTGSSCPGQCAPYEQAGGSCKGDSDCASGLVCGQTARCVAPAQEGEACKQGEPDCIAGFVCLGDDSQAKTPGTCIAIDTAFGGKKGADCSLDSGLCQSGLSCEITSVTPVAGTCVEKVAADADCTVAVPDECPDDQYCKLGQNPLAGGSCTPKPEPGEPCAAGLGDAKICAAYARCDGTVCRALAHAGEECSGDDACYSGHCELDACVTSSSCD